MRTVERKVGSPRRKRCEFAITIDTREQQPWLFRGLTTRTWEWMVPCSKGGLAQGDYAITNYESELVIERKSLEDLYGTLTTGRDRFKRELERISDCCRMGAVVVEASWEVISSPEHYRTDWRSQMRPQSVIGSIQSLAVRYPKVHWFCMPTRAEAEWTAFQLMRFAWERYMKRWEAQFERNEHEETP